MSVEYKMSYENTLKVLATRVMKTAKKECEESERKFHEEEFVMKSILTKEERKRLYYLPAILLELAWHFALKARKIAADNKIGALYYLSKEMKESNTWFERNKIKKFDKRNRCMVELFADKILVKGAKDVHMLFLSVNNVIIQYEHNIVCQNLKTYAAMSKLFLDLLFEFGTRSIQEISKRLDYDYPPYEHTPRVEALNAAMIAFCGKEDFNSEDKNVRLAMKIIENKYINRFKFQFFSQPPK